jgi:enoyl-CoA hydratase/carnithine racemase
MSDRKLLLDKDGGIGWITFNQPEKRNAVSQEMWELMADYVKDLAADPDIRVVVLRGAGDRAFVAGADISQFKDKRKNMEDEAEYRRISARGHDALAHLEKPLLAMIHGYCIGGGAGLALACDLRFADRSAKFAITPAKLGLVYSLESTKRMVDLVGPSRAKWILFAGLQIPADRAYELGLFDEVVDAGDLAELTYGFADTVCSRAQFSVRAGKAMVDKVVAGQVRDDDATTDLRNSSFDTEDFTEGVQAFMAKRSPNFTWS